MALQEAEGKAGAAEAGLAEAKLQLEAATATAMDASAQLRASLATCDELRARLREVTPTRPATQKGSPTAGQDAPGSASSESSTGSAMRAAKQEIADMLGPSSPADSEPQYGLTDQEDHVDGHRGESGDIVTPLRRLGRSRMEVGSSSFSSSYAL